MERAGHRAAPRDGQRAAGIRKAHCVRQRIARTRYPIVSGSALKSDSRK